MKLYHLLLIIVLLSIQSVHAQSVAINTDGSSPNPNAILDVKSGTKGILIPRMDLRGAAWPFPIPRGLLFVR